MCIYGHLLLLWFTRLKTVLRIVGSQSCHCCGLLSGLGSLKLLAHSTNGRQKMLGYFFKAYSGFLRQIFAYRDIPKSLLKLLSPFGFGSGLSTFDLIQTHTTLHLFPQFLYSAEDNNSHFPFIQASCVIKVIVDSCLPSSPCSGCCQITPSARYTQTWGWSSVPPLSLESHEVFPCPSLLSTSFVWSLPHLGAPVFKSLSPVAVTLTPSLTNWSKLSCFPCLKNVIPNHC